MADYTTIDNPAKHFNTVLYTGNGSTQSITGVGFQPDWTWIKNRSRTDYHILVDAVRGAPKEIYSNLGNVEYSNSNGLTAFGSDGFSVGSANDVNYNGSNLVAWNWLGANGTASNSDGSITSTVSANQTAGFSVVTYTSNSTSSNETVGHGLGVKPDMVITKNRDSGYNWDIYHSSLGYNANLIFTTAATRSGAFGTSEPTSTVFRTSPSYTTNSTDKYVAYCFAEKQGYSKFGKWTGTGQSSGPFIYTGFRPAFLSWKMSSSTENWYINDNKREPFNDDAMTVLYPNLSNADGALNDEIDLLSNGFKINGTNSAHNTDGATYIYWAFAEHPFVTAGTKAAGPAR